MKHKSANLRERLYLSQPYATRLNKYMVRDSSIWDMTHPYGTWHIHVGHDTYIWDRTHSYETWLIHVRHKSANSRDCLHLLYTHMRHASINIWHMTHPYRTWLIHMRQNTFIWDMTPSYGTCLSKYVVHDSFTWDMTLEIFRATRFFDIVSFLFCVVLPCVCDVRVCSTHRGDFIFLNVSISTDTDINT